MPKRGLGFLNAANEAILRSPLRDELLQRTCEAATAGKWLVAMAVLVPGKDGQLAPAAGAGRELAFLMTLPGEDGLAWQAYTSKESCIVTSSQDDARGRAWREHEAARRFAAAAAVPLLNEAACIGVAVFLFNSADGVTAVLVRDLERLAANMAFTWSWLARDESSARLNKLVLALNTTNEVLMRAESRANLYQLICDTVVAGGPFSNTTIFLPDATGTFLYPAAFSGFSLETHGDIKLPLVADGTRRFTIIEDAYLTGKSHAENDVLSLYGDVPYAAERLRAAGAASTTGIPLHSHGKSIAVLSVSAHDTNTFTPEILTILDRLAANVSFAFENFDRADEQRKADERIRYLATHDSLTNLPNRATFNEFLGFSLKTAQRYQRKCAVLFIDLDRFKIINDSLGHEAGDRLLIEVATRLRGGVRAGDIVARLGGDEFMILLNEVSNAEEIEGVAENLLRTLGIPMDLGGHECRVTGSIGIALYPEDGHDVQTLMRHADAAMYLAKSEGKNAVRYFSAGISHETSGRLDMEAGLRRALECGEFKLDYQPKLDAVTRRISGVEALIRWDHPELGELQPLQFIHIAEETGLILPIGRWVLRTACAQFMAWQRHGLPIRQMAVNVSPRQFTDESLLADIDACLAANGMDPKHLQIEITESMVLLNVEQAIRVLDAIQSRGVRVAIDDFGTGYSSMSMLKRFPIDTIKIDQSFVRDLPHCPEDKAITRAIIEMGKALGLTIVAEGVETTEQNAFLCGHDCDEVQGFLFSKPVPPEGIWGLFAAQAGGVLARAG